MTGISIGNLLFKLTDHEIRSYQCRKHCLIMQVIYGRQRPTFQFDQSIHPAKLQRLHIIQIQSVASPSIRLAKKGALEKKVAQTLAASGLAESNLQ